MYDVITQKSLKVDNNLTSLLIYSDKFTILLVKSLGVWRGYQRCREETAAWLKENGK